MRLSKHMRQLAIGLPILSSILFVTACANKSDSLQHISGTQGCTDFIPHAALRERKIDVELAQTAIQAITLGKAQVQYADTVKVVLNDQALVHWVREEMVCQGKKAYPTQEGRDWFVQMKEISEKATAPQLIQWLKENPPPATVRSKGMKLSKEVSDLRVQRMTAQKRIEALSGHVEQLQKDLSERNAKLRSGSPWATLSGDVDAAILDATAIVSAANRRPDSDRVCCVASVVIKSLLNDARKDYPSAVPGQALPLPQSRNDLVVCVRNITLQIVSVELIQHSASCAR